MNCARKHTDGIDSRDSTETLIIDRDPLDNYSVNKPSPLATVSCMLIIGVVCGFFIGVVFALTVLK